MARTLQQARRSCLSVPGESEKMLNKAATLSSDHVFFDLEDSVAPQHKDVARKNIIRAVRENDWGTKTLVVRINAINTQWCFRDIIEIVSEIGNELDALMLPKAETASDIAFVANLLNMVEAEAGVGEALDIEALIETARGVRNAYQIASASPRMAALHFGGADMSASLGLPTVSVGETLEGYPGDQWHYVLERVLISARDAGILAIDGPYGFIKNLDGYRASAMRGRALGFDGKWALHPGQVDIANEVFTPSAEAVAKARELLAAYERAMTVDSRGAALLNDEMIDEATRKMAERVLARAGE